MFVFVRSDNTMAAPVKLFGKDIKAYEDIDIDKLLETLTEEELEELGQELIDPDVSWDCFRY